MYEPGRTKQVVQNRLYGTDCKEMMVPTARGKDCARPDRGKGFGKGVSYANVSINCAQTIVTTVQMPETTEDLTLE